MIRLWTPDGRSRGTLEIGDGQDVLDISFTSDSSMLAALGYGNVFMWDLETGTRITGLRVPDRAARSVALSPDGTLVAIGDQSGLTTIQDRVTGRVLAELQGAEGDVENLMFSPDGTVVAFPNDCWHCESDEQDTIIRLWDAHNGNLLHSLEGHTGIVEGLAFNSDGSILASIARDGTLRLWNPITGEALVMIETSAYTVTFNNEGSMLAASRTDGTIGLWSVVNNQ